MRPVRRLPVSDLPWWEADRGRGGDSCQSAFWLKVSEIQCGRESERKRKSGLQEMCLLQFCSQILSLFFSCLDVLQQLCVALTIYALMNAV